MYKLIEEYILLDREDRQKHLKLDEPCVEIGGANSKEYKGLLAHFLKTTIPTQTRMIHLCHACDNHKCSNVFHLYWGTPKENFQDQVEAGKQSLTIFEKMVKKYGLEEAKRKVRKQDHSNRGPSPNRLTEEELEEHRKVLESFDQTKRGWVGQAAKTLGISHTHVRRIMKML